MRRRRTLTARGRGTGHSGRAHAGEASRPQNAAADATSMVNVLVGLWLTISSVILARHPGERVNALLVAAAAFAIALLARRVAMLRWADVPLGAWFFLSLWIVPRLDRWTDWSAVCIGATLAMTPLVAEWLEGHEPARAEA